jgi:hypothetical protein
VSRKVFDESLRDRRSLEEVVQLEAADVQIQGLIIERGVVQSDGEQGLQEQDAEQDRPTYPSAATTRRGCPAELGNGTQCVARLLLS